MFPDRVKCDLIIMDQVVGTLELLGYSIVDDPGGPKPVAGVLLTVQSEIPHRYLVKGLVDSFKHYSRTYSGEPCKTFVAGETAVILGILTADWVDKSDGRIAGLETPEETLKVWAAIFTGTIAKD